MNYYRLLVLVCVIAFMAIVAGTYTRLADAGLGCPDWSGCYGELTVPETPAQVGGLLLVQFYLGIGSVRLHLPLGAAIAQNGVAALLLVSLVYLNFRLWRQQH